MDDTQHLRLGWIGTGRMGTEIVSRLLTAGNDVAIYNRTRAKTEPLTALGARIVDHPSELADRDIVFTMVFGSADLLEVVLGDDGLLSRGGATPGIVVDSSTVSVAASEQVRTQLAERGSSLIAAPVSGNPKVVRSGRASVVASGELEAFETARPYLEHYGQAVTYAGGGAGARLVKICHNLMLGVVAQTLAETTVLAEKGGVSRADYLAFLNDSVMGSLFTRYKTPAIVTLDWTPTFTPALLRKDFDLGLESAAQLGSRLPLSARGRELVQEMMDAGLAELDFQALLLVEAEAAGLELRPEDTHATDGLDEEPVVPAAS